jgi:hypothetical protein
MPVVCWIMFIPKRRAAFAKEARDLDDNHELCAGSRSQSCRLATEAPRDSQCIPHRIGTS